MKTVAWSAGCSPPRTGVFVLIFSHLLWMREVAPCASFLALDFKLVDRGCLPSDISGTQCNKCFSVVYFCSKKNQSFASTHWLGNAVHSCSDPAPFLSCFWDGLMGEKAAPLYSCASALGCLGAKCKAETQPCVVGSPQSTVPSSQSLTNLLFLTWKHLNFQQLSLVTVIHQEKESKTPQHTGRTATFVFCHFTGHFHK